MKGCTNHNLTFTFPRAEFDIKKLKQDSYVIDAKRKFQTKIAEIEQNSKIQNKTSQANRNLSTCFELNF